MDINGKAPPMTTTATRRTWIGLAVLALPTLLLSLDMSVLYLALPTLSADLGADSTQQLWILDIYSFMIAGFLVTMGTLGDRIGRRKLLLIGAGRVRRRLGGRGVRDHPGDADRRPRAARRRRRHAHAVAPWR